MHDKGHVKLLATSTGTHLVHDLVADAVLARVVMSIQVGRVEIITVPVVEDGQEAMVRILVSPTTQLSVRDTGGSETGLSEAGLAAVAALGTAPAGADAAEDLDDTDVATSFVDFSAYDTPPAP
jgi:hypothetical protein